MPRTIEAGHFRLSVVFPGVRRMHSIRACRTHCEMVAATYRPAGAMVPMSVAEEDPSEPCDICRIVQIAPVEPTPLHTQEARLVFPHEGRRIIGLFLCPPHVVGLREEFKPTRGINPAGPMMSSTPCDVCLLLAEQVKWDRRYVWPTPANVWMSDGDE